MSDFKIIALVVALGLTTIGSCAVGEWMQTRRDGRDCGVADE